MGSYFTVGSTWGNITGTLSAQLDLMGTMNGFALSESDANFTSISILGRVHFVSVANDVAALRNGTIDQKLVIGNVNGSAGGGSLVLNPQASPSSPVEGQIYSDSTIHRLVFRTNSVSTTILTSADSVSIVTDSGWTANADSGDKTKSIGTSASIATIATALNTLSSGSGSLLQAVAEKCKSLETALSLKLIPNV